MWIDHCTGIWIRIFRCKKSNYFSYDSCVKVVAGRSRPLRDSIVRRYVCRSGVPTYVRRVNLLFHWCFGTLSNPKELIVRESEGLPSLASKFVLSSRQFTIFGNIVEHDRNFPHLLKSVKMCPFPWHDILLNSPAQWNQESLFVHFLVKIELLGSQTNFHSMCKRWEMREIFI